MTPTIPDPASLSRLEAFLPMLGCPVCGGGVAWAGPHRLVCQKCKQAYPVRSGVPILLPPTMQEPGVGTVSDGDPVSKHPYSPAALEIIQGNADGWVLDLGAGGKLQRIANVIQLDIFRYPMTDVVATADRLPFRDNAFRAVVSQAVFEHLQYPEWAAAEIRRVVQPGGVIKIDTAFLQPEHGYPHHFFNASETGLRHWFRSFDIQWSGVESYQHPKWSLSWFLRVYLDRVGVSPANVLRETKLGALSDALERHSAGVIHQEDRDVLAALDALPRHEHRTLAAGVSVTAINPPKYAEFRQDSGGQNPEAARHLDTARQVHDELIDEYQALRERHVVALDRGNYFAQFHPGFGSLEQLGARAWVQFRLAALARTVLPRHLWFRLRQWVKGSASGVSERRSVQSLPFCSIVLAPMEASSLVNTFFSLVRQTYSGWELVLLESPHQKASVRKAMADLKLLDERVRVLMPVGEGWVESIQSQYVLQLPEGITLAFDALSEMVTLVQDRPSTTCVIADTMLLDAVGERRPTRCLGGLPPGATEQDIARCYAVAVRATAKVRQDRGAPLCQDSNLQDENGIAYIHKALFRLDR